MPGVKDGFWDEVQVDGGGDHAMPSVDKYLRASLEPGLFWEWAEGRDTACPCDTATGQEHRPQVRMDGGWRSDVLGRKRSSVNEEGEQETGLLSHVE